MTKIKKLFETPKKAAITVLCMFAIIAVIGTGSVFAASAIAESSAIGEENAKNFAFADAGVDPVSAQITKIEFDYEQGQFVYEIEFVAEGTEYEYWIKASDGSVVKKEIERVTLDGSNATVTAKITLDDAKQTALEDAGVAISDATFTKEKLDLDDGVSVYEIEFNVDNVEYEYKVNANTGAIYSKTKETFNRQENAAPSIQPEEPQPSKEDASNSGSGVQNQQSANQSQSNSQKLSLEQAKSKAIADAKVSASAVTYTKAKLDYDDGALLYDIEFYTSTHEYDYEIDAKTGNILSRDVEAIQNKGNNSTNSGNTSSDIGLDKAKSIAAKHAGFSVSSVNFSKAKLERDDGITVYEIEFYKDGVEYDYTINASNGNILEFNADRDD